MSQNFTYSSANNTYIPTFNAEASGAVVVSYARDPKKFGVNRYAQVVKVPTQVGTYVRLNPFDQSRLLSLDGAANVWADGADRPINTDVQFEYPMYKANRYTNGFYIGDLAAQQSAWDVVAAKAGTAATLMMTLQTSIAISKAIAGLAANINATTSGTATSLGGGKWNAGFNSDGSANTSTFFRTGVQQVLSNITLNSNGMVDPADLIAVMNPNTAKSIAQSNEVTDTIKQSPFGMDSLRNSGDLNWTRWGLPSMLFGVGEVCVDLTVVTTTNPNAGGTGTQSYVLPDGDILFLSRPGAQEGIFNTSWSTLQGFFCEEMSVETWNDPVNRREVGSVTSNFTYEIVAPNTGFLVTAAI